MSGDINNTCVQRVILGGSFSSRDEPGQRCEGLEGRRVILVM